MTPKPQDYLRVSVIEISLLNEVFEKQPKNLSLNIFADTINKQQIDYLHESISKHPGKQSLKINILDRKEPNLSTPVNSKIGITVTPELLENLEKKKIRFKLS